MGYMNEEIKTTLNYKDVVLIAAMWSTWKEEENNHPEVEARASKLIKRLMREIHNPKEVIECDHFDLSNTGECFACGEKLNPDFN